MSIRHNITTIIFNSLYDVDRKSRIIVGIVRHPCKKANNYEVTVRLQCDKSTIDFLVSEWKDLMRWGIKDIQKYFNGTLETETLNSTWHGESYDMSFAADTGNRKLLFQKVTRDCCEYEKLQRRRPLQTPAEIEEQELLEMCEEAEQQDPLQLCEAKFEKMKVLKKCIKNKIRWCESIANTVQIFEKVLVRKIKKVSLEIFNTSVIVYDKGVVQEVIEHFTKEDKLSMLRLINRTCIKSHLEKIDSNGFGMFFYEVLTFCTPSIVRALNKKRPAL